MKKLLKIFVLITSVFLITGCGGNSVKEISYSDFDKMINNHEDFIIYVGSATCENCKEFSPKFNNIIKEYNIEDVYYVDLDKFSDDEKSKLNKIINISGTPTVAFIDDGTEESSFNRITGNVSEEKIISRLKSNDYID